MVPGSGPSHGLPYTAATISNLITAEIKESDYIPTITLDLSLPQNMCSVSAPPSLKNMVGDPKAPRSTASAVTSFSLCLTSCD